MEKQYCVYASTHVGKVRQVNEDSFILNTLTKDEREPYQNIKVGLVNEPLLCGVFDGMGGEQGGYQASKICAKEAADYYMALLKSEKDLESTVDHFVLRSTASIRNFLRDNNFQRGGSTFAMAYLKDGRMHLASMGDSRIYLLRGEELFLVSRDHTLANMKFEANIFTREEAEKSPESHMLTRYLGMDLEGQPPEIEIYNAIKMKPEDKLLICSDGLYDMCSDEEIREVLLNNTKGYGVELVTKALKNGGIDNITCIVVEQLKEKVEE